MKKINFIKLLSVLLVGLSFTIRSDAQVIFSDDFEDGVIDAAMWTVASPRAGSLVVESGGYVEMDDAGTLIYNGELTNNFIISGSFSINEDTISNRLGIFFRNNGSLASGQDYANGIYVFFEKKHVIYNNENDLDSAYIGAVNWPTAELGDIAIKNDLIINTGEIYDFLIIVNGNTIEVYFDNSNEPILTAQSPLDLGDGLLINSRETKNSVRLYDIFVEEIDSPGDSLYTRVNYFTSSDFTNNISARSDTFYIENGDSITRSVPWSLFPMTLNFDVGEGSSFSSSGVPEVVSISDPSGLITYDGGTVTLNPSADSRTGEVTFRIRSPNSTTPIYDAEFVLNISRAPQTIIFEEQNDGGLFFMGDPIELIASSSSGLPVTFTLNNANGYNSTSKAVLVDSGDSQNVNELLYPDFGAGPVRIQATAPQSDDYEAATSVFQTVLIQPGQQYIVFDPVDDITHGAFPFQVSAAAFRRNLRTSNTPHPEANTLISGADVIFNIYSGPAYMGPDGETVIPVGSGQVFIQGFQGGIDANADGWIDFQSTSWLESFTAQETNTSSGAQFLDQWEWKSPASQTDTDYNEIAYGVGRIVAVGDGGRVMTSAIRSPGTPAHEPYEWTLQVSGVADNMNAVVRGLNRFVAVGEGGQVWTSTDGVGAWTGTTIPGAPDLLDIAYNSFTNTYIVVGTDGYIATGSDPLDGLTFTQQNSQIDAGINLNAVTVVNLAPPGPPVPPANYLYVAVGTDGAITTSPNGVAWTAQRYGTAFDFSDVIQHAPIPPDAATANDAGIRGTPIVIVGENGLILTSQNGINWTTAYTNDNINLNSVASFLYQEPTTVDISSSTPRVFINVFVAVGDEGKVVTSRDGINWTERNSRYPFSFNNIIYDTTLGFFAAVGNQFTIFSSPNGEVWNLMDAAEDEGLHAVAFGNDAYVAVGDTGLILHSTDGDVWTEVPLANLPLAAQSESFFGVTYGGPANQFIAVGSGNTIILSADGLNWSAASSIPAMPVGNFLGITFSSGRYVIAAGSFGLLSSADGDNWVRHTAGANTHITSVTYSETIGNFAAVGTFGTILLSSDGVNWFDVFSGTNVNLTGVTYSAFDGIYVAVGENGLILTSEYGDSWTVQESGTQFDLNAVTYVADEDPADGGTYVAVGNNFQVVSSRDGVQWIAQVTGILSALNGVGHGNGLIVAVGDYRSIITTRNAIPSGLDTWALHSPQIEDVPGINGLLFANNVHVAVGDAGLVLTSTDGLNWTQQTTGTVEDLKSIAYGNGRFVIVGGRAVLTSTNGVNWTQQTAITQQTWHVPLNSVTFGAGRFVAVGDGTMITSSSDGVNWILSNAFYGGAGVKGKETLPNLYGVTYGGGIYVAVGEASSVDLDCFGIKPFNFTMVAYSYDSMGWYRMYVPYTALDNSQCPIYVNSTLRAVTYGNNTFMAVGDGGVLTLNPLPTVRSVAVGDLVSYESDLSIRLRFDTHLNAVAYGAGQGVPRFTIVGDGGTVMTTLTGDIFEVRYPGVFDNLNAIIYGKNGFLAGGDNGRILDSATGESWRNIRSAGAIGQFNDISYGNQTLVLVGDSGAIYTSGDGQDWIARDSGISADINGVAFKPGSNSLFLGVADDGLAVYSSNSGATWQSSASIVTTRLNDVAFFPAANTFIVAGDNGVTLTTTNGVSWQIPSTSVTHRLNSIAVSSDTAVVVGANGTILTSPSTAISWTQRAIGLTNNEIFSVTYGQTDSGTNLFVAVGTMGLILTSTDGINWTAASPGSLTNAILSHVHYGNGQFVASGSGGTVLTSLDGQNWRARPSTSISSLQTGLYADGVHVLAGNFGTVLNSGTLSPKLDQTISFPVISDVAVTSNLESITLAATASSGLPVIYALADLSQASFVTVLGNVVRVNTAGIIDATEVGIIARQPGNSTYNPANVVPRSFFVVPINHEVGLTFNPGSPTVFAPSKSVTLSVESLRLDSTPTGLTTAPIITSNSTNVSVAGTTMTLLGAGTATISVTIPGGINSEDERFSPATALFTYEITKANQSISSLSVNNDAVFYRGDAPIAVTAQATSGLPVSVTKTSDPNGAVELSEGVMTFVRAGSVTLEFAQNGDENYNAANTVTVSFSVLDTPPGNFWASSVSNTTAALNSVTFANNQFVAVGSSTSILTAEPQSGSENLTWSRKTSGSTVLNDAIYAIDSFYAVGTDSILLRSMNGTQWSSINLPTIDQPLNALASNFVSVVAVGDAGTIIKGGASSTPWTVVTSGITQNINDIAYLQSVSDSSRNAYYAVADEGYILTSMDGVTWTSTKVSNANLLSITTGYTGSGETLNDLLVAVGDANTILTSVDGINWIARSSPATTLNAVTFGTDGSGNGRFLAVGNSGTIVTSQNGGIWAMQTSGVTADLRGVAYTDTLYVAVGTNGTIIASGEFEGKTSQVTGFADADLPVPQFGAAPVALTPLLSSEDLPNRFAVVSGPATIESGNQLVATGAGDVTVLAYQEGNDEFYPAPVVIRTLSIAKADQEIKFLAGGTEADPQVLSSAFGAPRLDIFSLDDDDTNDLTDDEGNPLVPASYREGTNVATNLPLSGTITGPGGFIREEQEDGSEFVYLAITGEGTIVITLNQDGSDDYNAAPPKTITIDVVGVFPTVTFAQPADNTTVTTNTPVLLQAYAADTGTGAGIDFVTFSANGSVIGSVDTPLSGTGLYYLNTWNPGVPGAYEVVATATDIDGNSSSTSITVNAVVATSAPPSIAVNAPASVALGSTPILTATALDTDGVVTLVEYFSNGVSVGTSAISPYSVGWKPSNIGNFLIHAVATDNTGNRVTTPPSMVTVTENVAVLPSVTITSPADNTTLAVNETIAFDVSATAVAGAILSVEFFLDGNLIDTDNTFPYTTSYTPVGEGTYTFQAAAIDSFGFRGVSTVHEVTIAAGSPPIVVLADIANQLVNTPVTLFATASDTEGFVTAVEFYINNTLFETVTGEPFTTTWTPVSSGTYQIKAIAVDNVGFRSLPSEKTATITSNAAPVVSFTYPTALNGGLEFTLGSSIYLQASATDSDGTIARVDFFEGQRLIGSATSAPYATAFTPEQVRSYSLRAVAVDDRGISSSVTTTITVEAGSGNIPEVAMLIPHTGTDLTASSTVLLEAFANGTNLGTVEIYINGVLRTGVTSPVASYYNNRFRPGLAGIYNVIAVATDAAGNKISSFPLALTAAASVGIAPNVNFAAPANVLVGQTRNITVTASDPDGSIAGVAFYVDGELLSTDTTPPYQFAWRPLEERSYQLLAIASDNRGNVNYTNSTIVAVVDGEDPSVAITNPVGDSVTVNTPVVLTASASDGTEGPIASLQFYVNNVAIGNLLTSEPFQTVWTPTVSGTYSIRAVATDSQGATGEATRTITAATAGVGPVISFSPTVTSYTLGNTVLLEANVSDSDGYITEVQFLDGSAALSPVLTPAGPTAFYQWTPSQSGKYYISLVAQDNSGNTTQSASVEFNIASPGPYQIKFVSPVVDTANPIRLGSDVVIEVEVDVGEAPASTARALRKVQFFANNELIGEDTAAPYSIAWRPASSGDQKLLAIATDMAGVIAHVQLPINIDVPNEDDSPPALSLSITADGNITENSRVMITANVDDEDIDILDGSVDENFKLTFYLNGEIVGESDMIGKFAAIIQPVALSDVVTDPNYRNYEVRAVAEDSAGNTRVVTLNKVYVARQFVSTPIVTMNQITTPFNVGIPTKIAATLRGSGQSDATVIFYANGFEIGSDSSAPYEINWTPDLYPGMQLNQNIVLSAVATRSPVQFDIDPDFNNTEIVDCTPVSVSNQVQVLLTKDNSTAEPEVEIITPSSDASFTAGEEFQLTARASISGAVGVLTNVKSVTYYQSPTIVESLDEVKTKTKIGESDTAAGSYSVSHNAPQIDGTVYLYAVALATNDNEALSAPVAISVSTGPLPTITSFTASVSGSTFLGLPITFNVAAEDPKGITRVEFRRALRGAEDQVTVLGYDFAAPYSIQYYTDRSLPPGTYVFTVRVVNGATPQKEKISEAIVITLELPNPLGSGQEFTDDFVYQSMNDLLFRVPTSDELNNYDSILSYDPAKGRASIISAILKLDDYRHVRRTILANMLLRNQLPGSYDLFVDAELARLQSITYLVERYQSDLLTALKRTYGDDAVIPSQDSPQVQFTQMITYLWDIKYGSGHAISSSNYNTLYESFRLYGTTNFLALWVQDVNNMSFGDGTITPVFNLTNVPNNFAYERAQIAGLFIGLLAQIPTEAEVMTLMDQPLTNRINYVLDDPRYAARFTSTSFDGYILSNGWKYSAWFGLYYDGYRPWVYHLENGWLYEHTNSINSMWLFSVEEEAWLWTNVYYYPWAWSADASNGGWLYLADE